MHHDTDFVSPPALRLGCLALITSPAGVLLVEKRYKEGPEAWGLPGGCAHLNEEPREAVRREVHEETSFDVKPDALLVIHWMPATGTASAGINVVFDCGDLSHDLPPRLPAEELSSYRYVPEAELDSVAAPYTAWRVRAALAARAGDAVEYLTGHPSH
ncbi:NUDIX hydrolase [Streptomyces sp. ODS28]|uniref:NUDIX hydrolase n=1 Tax=Streptomyces sp. ODS28 TaxID=3136688 RepID=UPI0031E5B67B